MPNADQPKKLTDLLPDGDAPGFGSAMLRLAEMAAALHRGDAAAALDSQPWTGLTQIDFVTQDKVEHGSLAVTRSARDRGTATTEGSR